MGASASHPTEDGAHPPIRALHVLRVTPGSPASATDIEPFFDFVVSVDEGLLGDQSKGIDVSYLERIVESHEGRPLLLVVWSSKTETYRQVTIVPSREWSIHANSGSPFISHSRLPSLTASSHPGSRAASLDAGPAKPSLLGLSMRICEPATSLDNVWHILEVLEGSPAESAGLVPYGDWIVGWSGGTLRGENDFLDVVEAHVEKPLRVYVYSYDFDALREVVLVPNRMWGGEGLLGCGVGFGLLHRIPKTRQENVFDGDAEEDAPQENHYNHHNGNGYHDDMQEQELFVPADDIYDDEHEVPTHSHAHHDPHHSHHHQHLHEPPLAAPQPRQPPTHNPFLPESEEAPSVLIPSIQTQPPDDGEDSEKTPSPSSTPTPSSPSIHPSEISSIDPGPIIPPSSIVRTNSPFSSGPFRQSFGPGSVPTARWGSMGGRFSPGPGGAGARRATPTQMSFGARASPAPVRNMNHDSDEDDDESSSGIPRRSPNGSMTSVDD